MGGSRCSMWHGHTQSPRCMGGWEGAGECARAVSAPSFSPNTHGQINYTKDYEVEVQYRTVKYSTCFPPCVRACVPACDRSSRTEAPTAAKAKATLLYGCAAACRTG